MKKLTDKQRLYVYTILRISQHTGRWWECPLRTELKKITPLSKDSNAHTGDIITLYLLSEGYILNDMTDVYDEETDIKFVDKGLKNLIHHSEAENLDQFISLFKQHVMPIVYEKQKELGLS